jgi:carboxypeptidase C (cathepsin A)
MAMAIAVGARDDSDLVTSLPGLSFVPDFNMYAGRLTGMFYWLIEAKQGADALPLALWLQGGPGCSSLLGLTTEHGPIRIVENGPNQTATVVRNPNSWHAKSNMLYLESPRGVGYSLAGPHVTGDTVACAENYAFLQAFYAKYPRYQASDFFITGESHAGVYVPMLATKILHENSLLAAGQSTQAEIRLKGCLVGNPSGLASTGTAAETWPFGYVTFMRYHGLLSNEQYQEVTQACTQLAHGVHPGGVNCSSALHELSADQFYGIVSCGDTASACGHVLRTLVAASLP